MNNDSNTMKRLKNGTISKISGTSLWKVEEEFYWLCDYEDKNGWKVIAESGFITDYWSIPWLFRIFFDPTRYNSYVLHDAMYSDKVKYHIGNSEWEYLTRTEADRILLEWITYEWAGVLEKWCIFLWVRLFWWMYWNAIKIGQWAKKG